MKSPTLVLTTVNAPYSKKLDAQELVHCLLDPSSAKVACGPMSSFFGDVKPELQIAFAEMYGVSHKQLVAAAKKFAEFSGQSYPLARRAACAVVLNSAKLSFLGAACAVSS